MMNLDSKFFLKKSYVSLPVQYLTEEQYDEYIRALVNYCLYKKCRITSPVVYAVFMFAKYDIDRERYIILRNQDNSKKAGREKTFTAVELVDAIKNKKLTSYKDLQNYFGVCKATISRRIKDIKDESIQKQLFDILKANH